MVQQYLRQVSLIVGDNSGNGLDLSALRITFQVSLATRQTPNAAHIRVYNLAAATVSQIQSDYNQVSLQAGYAGNFGTIFRGTILPNGGAVKGRESATDTYIDIAAVDSDVAYNYATVNKTLAAGSTPNDHAAEIVRSLGEHGVTQGYIPDDLPATALPRGKVMYGMTKDHARRLAQNTGTDWYVQQGSFSLLPTSAYLPGDAIVLSPSTGMVGIPELSPGGLRVRCLLNPAVTNGRRIQVQSDGINLSPLGTNIADSAQQNPATFVDANGFYTSMIVTHIGDTRGNEYYTDIIALSPTAQQPVGAASNSLVVRN